MSKIYPISSWHLASFDYSPSFEDILRNEEWMEMGEPIDVHTFLINRKIIKDPAYGLNDLESSWIENKIWVYHSQIEVSLDILQSEYLTLKFYGIDTFSTIFINGLELARTDNMFVEYSFPVKELLHEGKNDIHILFFPVSDAVKEKKLPTGFWTNYSTERAFSRKAGYSFGWDWCPRILTVGLWKEVELIEHNNSLLSSLTIHTKLNDDFSECKLSIDLTSSGLIDYTRVNILITTPCGEKKHFSLSDEIVISNPQLWHVKSYGEQCLYTVEAEYLNEKIKRYFGIRKIELLSKLPSGENCFLFKINGEDIFLKGANWVPMSNRPGSISHNDYELLIQKVLDAGMNTLVLWGGGIYEPEYFYSLCDRHGIVLLQYFMFACGEYPDWDISFIENVREEIFQQVRRLDNHPSVIMYIGNVENTMLSEKIGLSRKMYGDDLFFEYIPKWLKELNSNTLYQPTSPYGGDSANSDNAGDVHNWNLWFKDIPYYEYAKDNACFASEFGIHGTPTYENVLSFCGKENLSLDDFEFSYFNKDQDPNRMFYYINQHIGSISSLKEYCDKSMLVQSEALRFAIEHYRRRFPNCAGATLWQLNDSAACQSWSLIDYELNPKAAYYNVKKAFKDISLSIRYDSANESSVFVCNNSNQHVNRKIHVVVCDYFGNKYYEDFFDVCIGKGQVKKITTIAVGGRFFPNVIIPNRLRFYLLYAEFVDDEVNAIRLFDDIKNLKFPNSIVNIEIHQKEIVFSSSVFTKYLRISGENLDNLILEDNYFDLLPNCMKKVSYSKRAEKRNVYRIEALNMDAYEVVI